LDQFPFGRVNLRFGASQYFSADSKTGRRKGCSPECSRHHLTASCCPNRPETLQTRSAAHVRGMLLGLKSDIFSRSLTISDRLVEIRKMSCRPPGGSAKAKPGQQTSAFPSKSIPSVVVRFCRREKVTALETGRCRTRLEAEVGRIRLSLFRESRIQQCGGVLKYWSHPLHQSVG